MVKSLRPDREITSQIKKSVLALERIMSKVHDISSKRSQVVWFQNGAKSVIFVYNGNKLISCFHKKCSPEEKKHH